MVHGICINVGKETDKIMEAEIYTKRGWIQETDENKLVEMMEHLLNKCGYSILKYVSHSFEPQGFTAVWVIAESHLAIHTFPEANKTYFELSSCNREKNQHFFELISHNIIDFGSHAK